MLGSAPPADEESARVDLRFSAEDEAFRAEARDWLTDAARRRVRGRPRPRRPRRRALAVRRAPGVGARARRRRAGTASPGPTSTAGAACRSPSRSSSTRSTPAPAARAGSGSSARGCSARRSSTSAPTSRSSGSSRRSSRATSSGARATPSPTPAPTSPTSQTRAELDGDEWVIDGQKVWTSLAHWARLVLRAVPHRPRRAQAPGHLVPARADGPARHRDPPHRADHRHVGVQRGVLRRRPHRARRTSSAR